MRPALDACNMQKGMALVLIALILLPLGNADTNTDDESRESVGGHAILLEHYTATWCDTCATVDPWITEFSNSHSSRMVRVALHPDDHDPFGSPLTTKRLALKQADHSLSLPTFWFDGQGEMEGTVSQTLLENQLRSAESERVQWMHMRVLWDTWHNQTQEDAHQLSIDVNENLPSNAIITVFRLETLEMTTEIAYNGIDIHHDVATQMISFAPNGTIVDSYDGEQGWSMSEVDLNGGDGASDFILETTGRVSGFVTIIEVNGDVRGVIGISDDDKRPNAENFDILALLLLLGVLAISANISRRDTTH